MGFSIVLHAALLVGSALAVPSLDATDAEITVEDRTFLVGQAFVTRAQRELVAWPATRIAEVEPDAIEPADNRCDDLHGGNMGEPTAAVTGKRHGVQGPAGFPVPHLPREPRPRHDTPCCSTIGVHPDIWGGDPDAPTSFEGQDDAIGADAASTRGRMWGREIGVSFGALGFGIGPPDLCEHCGIAGHGAAAQELPTAGGGVTSTERSR